MSMQSKEGRQIAAFLAHRAGATGTASQIAEATAAAWQEIDAALTPIIGSRGVAALFKRSLHLNRQVHPCLAGMLESVQTTLDVAPLKAVLAQQSSAEAAAAGGDVLQTFYELLTNLVGPSLTERLLRSVWITFLSGPAAQDISA